MAIVTVGIRTLADPHATGSGAGEAGPDDPDPHVTFPTPELLWEAFTPKRWDLLKAMTGQGPMSLREAARRVRRDIKAVHGDVTILLNGGLLTKTPNGKIEFPYEGVRVDFLLIAA